MASKTALPNILKEASNHAFVQTLRITKAQKEPQFGL
jgi:hypothetical protein